MSDATFVSVKFFVKIIVCTMITLVVCACSTMQSQIVTESDYFTSDGGGFTIDTKKKQLLYGIRLKANRTIIPGNFLEVKFENPTGGDPLLSTQVVHTYKDLFLVKSPPVTGLQANKDYKIEIYLYNNQNREELLELHTQFVRSNVTQANFGW